MLFSSFCSLLLDSMRFFHMIHLTLCGSSSTYVAHYPFLWLYPRFLTHFHAKKGCVSCSGSWLLCAVLSWPSFCTASWTFAWKSPSDETLEVKLLAPSIFLRIVQFLFKEVIVIHNSTRDVCTFPFSHELTRQVGNYCFILHLPGGQCGWAIFCCCFFHALCHYFPVRYLNFFWLICKSPLYILDMNLGYAGCKLSSPVWLSN